MGFKKVHGLFGALVVLLGALQYTWWFGKGGAGDVARTRAQITSQEQELDVLRTRNSKLAAEVVDLKQGFEAIEEIARNDMGMIKDAEIFYQFIDSSAVPAAKTPAPSAPP